MSTSHPAYRVAFAAASGVILAIASLGIASSQDPGAPLESPSRVDRDCSVARTADADRHLKLALDGTALMPSASGVSKLERILKRDALDIDIRIEGLLSARRFGSEYLTYVAWRVDGDGSLVPLGELRPERDGDARLSTRIEEPEYIGLIVTAEPHFAVSEPSDLIILSSRAQNRAARRADWYEVSCKLLARGHYIAGRTDEELELSLWSDPRRALPEIIQARNALEIAAGFGAEEHAYERLFDARRLLIEAQKALTTAGDRDRAEELARRSALASEQALWSGQLRAAEQSASERELNRIQQQIKDQQTLIREQKQQIASLEQLLDRERSKPDAAAPPAIIVQPPAQAAPSSAQPDTAADLERQRTSLIEERDRLRADQQSFRLQRDMEMMRSELLAQLEQAVAREREITQSQRGELQAERAAVAEELQSLRAERAALSQQLTELSEKLAAMEDDRRRREQERRTEEPAGATPSARLQAPETAAPIAAAPSPAMIPQAAPPATTVATQSAMPPTAVVPQAAAPAPAVIPQAATPVAPVRQADAGLAAAPEAMPVAPLAAAPAAGAAETRMTQTERELADQRRRLDQLESGLSAELARLEQERARLDVERRQLAEQQARARADQTVAELITMQPEIEPVAVVEETTVAVEPERKRRGVWPFRRKRQQEPVTVVATPAVQQKVETPTALPAAEAVDTTVVVTEPEKEKKRWWLFGRKRDASADVQAAPEQPVEDVGEEPELRRRWWIFGRRDREEAQQPVAEVIRVTDEESSDAVLEAERRSLDAERARQQAEADAERARLDTERARLDAERLRLTQEAATSREAPAQPAQPAAMPVPAPGAEGFAPATAAADEQPAVIESIAMLDAARAELESERARLESERQALEQKRSAEPARQPAAPPMVPEWKPRLASVFAVSETDRGLVVRLPDLEFATGKHQLQPEARELLARFAGMLSGVDGLRIAVEGHTDDRGPKSINQTLSEKRAGEVMSYLIEQGIAPEALEAAGYGDDRPIASNTTSEGRRLNRRVELVVWESDGA